MFFLIIGYSSIELDSGEIRYLLDWKGGDIMARDVMCTVENCRYWENGRKCTAEGIEVNVDGGGQKAGYTGETNCQTFTSKAK